jgi:hypothetical protein
MLDNPSVLEQFWWWKICLCMLNCTSSSYHFSMIQEYAVNIKEHSSAKISTDSIL